MRLFTATEWQLMGWYGRARVHAQRLALIEQLGADHRARYPDANKAFCDVPGCRRPSRALSMCDTHYRRCRRAAA